MFDPNTSVCVGVCALTRRPLLQQSISGVTIDSVLFGWLRFFTILFILLYWGSNEPAANTKTFLASSSFFKQNNFFYSSNCEVACKTRRTYQLPLKLTSIRPPQLFYDPIWRRTRGAGAACCRVCLRWGFWGRRWGRAVRRVACWCGCSPTVCTSPSGALGSLRGLYLPPCLPPAQICRERETGSVQTVAANHFLHIYVFGKQSDFNCGRADCSVL